MAKPMLDGTLMFPSEYLAAEEFGGRDVKLVIKDVKLDDLRMTDGGTERKPILTFTKTKKKLVLNKTNATTIAKLYGGEARNWVGKEITLYPTECNAFGQQVECIRVRAKNRTGAVPPAVPETGAGADTSAPVTDMQQIQGLLANRTVSEADYDRACELSGLDPEQIETDDVMAATAAGDYRTAIKLVIGKIVMAGGGTE